MDPAHLAKQPKHLLVLGQHDQGERLDAVVTSHTGEDREKSAAQSTALELIDHGDRGLRDICIDGAVVAGNADDSFLAVVLARGGDKREAVVVVDDSQAVCQRVWEALKG